MDKLHQFKELAFGSRLKRLSDTLMKDAKKVYKQLYIDFEPTLMPVFKTIADENEVSIGEIATFLDISQPAITQFINTLQKKKLLKIIPDKNDKRKKTVALSKKGLETFEKLQPIWTVIEAQLIAITTTKPTSFMNHLLETEKKQKQTPLYQRVMTQLKENVTIENYTPKHAPHFYELNVEWLEKFFYVEPYDKKVLSNPKEFIIDKGGYIFFAKYNNEIVGTVALMKQGTMYELTKMAVSPKFQGLKIGQQLMDHCVSFSKKNGWKSIMLYSHRKLVPAITMYKKVGFTEVELEKDCHYERSDIKMELHF
ncbi:MAG: bifunctional helix-turn-helix transcriptional regulator/GNAT family N-acetyltransferase [Flavobacteriaceae bacterium]|nr:bifunctional helix-turn-helix transcriptional regulator/GNAT family N-acetyltransferase [Flavobacteriaceae bacterium]